MLIRNIIVGALATLALAMIGWNFSAVAEMPEKYVLKQDNTREHQEINDKLDMLIEHLINKDEEE